MAMRKIRPTTKKIPRQNLQHVARFLASGLMLADGPPAIPETRGCCSISTMLAFVLQLGAKQGIQGYP